MTEPAAIAGGGSKVPATGPAGGVDGLGAQATEPAAIAVAGLSVRLGAATVLNRLDLEVAAGEWLNVVGPNGAGKTTLLRAILGSAPFAGAVRVTGLADRRPSARPRMLGRSRGQLLTGPDRRPAARAQMLAYVPQTPVIPAGMAVIDYVLLGRTPYRGVFAGDSARDLTVAGEVLHRLDLSSLAGRELRSLSGGERQRAVLARALAQQAPVLLLDEPTTSLDLGHQQEVLELVEELRGEGGLTVVATLHDLTLAARYGDRVALLAGGRIVAEGHPARVLTPGTIAEHFDAHVRVIEDDHGPVIVPMARNPKERP